MQKTSPSWVLSTELQFYDYGEFVSQASHCFSQQVKTHKHYNPAFLQVSLTGESGCIVPVCKDHKNKRILEWDLQIIVNLPRVAKKPEHWMHRSRQKPLHLQKEDENQKSSVKIHWTTTALLVHNPLKTKPVFTTSVLTQQTGADHLYSSCCVHRFLDSKEKKQPKVLTKNQLQYRANAKSKSEQFKQKIIKWN